MKKIKYLIKHIFYMDYKSFLKAINRISKEIHKSKIFILIDIIKCVIKYQAGYVDYELFEMYKMTDEERKTVITGGKNTALIREYNNPEYIKYFNSKLKFNEKFNEYLNRDWLEIKDNFEEFQKFCNKHKEIVVKPDNASCGKGIEIIDTTRKDLKGLFKDLIKNNQILIEEKVVQCKELNNLYPYSINTIRVVTLKSNIVVALLRIGDKKNVVDNFNHGGLVCPINIETGRVEYPAVDKQKNTYQKHPLTKEKIIGLKIPKWEEIKKLCIEASKIIPEVGYIGWDVCVGENKPFFIEGNEYPGFDLYQLPAHRKDNIGLLPKFMEAINKDERNKK